MNRCTAIGFALVFAASGAILVTAGKAGYRLNTTASMPWGLWRIGPASADIARGTIVSACLPSGAIVRMALRRGYLEPGYSQAVRSHCSSRSPQGPATWW